MQEDSKAPLISIVARGGLGDHLQTARYIRDLVQQSEGFTFDIYTKRPKVAAWAFGSIQGFHAAYDEWLLNETFYDATLDVLHFVSVRRSSLRVRRLRKYPRLLQLLENVLRATATDLCAQHSPELDNLLAQKAVFSNCTSANYLHYLTGIDYGGDNLAIACNFTKLLEYDLNPQSYITVHNGFDKMFVPVDHPTKVYPRFQDVVQNLRRKYPEIVFVQLGSLEAGKPIDAVDLNLVGKTTLSESAGIIQNALLHIDSEGGLVHVAACVGTPSAVVFGPTPLSFFGYPRNLNIHLSTCGGCWWVNDTWMSKCPRGFHDPVCMSDQDPLSVADAIATYLDSHLVGQDRVEFIGLKQQTV
jgi:hypothetical protein